MRIRFGFVACFCFFVCFAQTPNTFQELEEQPIIIKGVEFKSQPHGEFQVTIVNGDVYIQQGDFALYCDRAVVWNKLETIEETTESQFPGLKGKNKKEELQKTQRTQIPLKKEENNDTPYFEVYAEGGVSLIRGKEHFDAEQLIFNFQTNRGMILDGVTRLIYRSGNQDIPLHIRAEEIRIYSKEKFFLTHPKISTCTFGEPHYDFRAKEMELISRQPEGVQMHSSENTFHVLEIPLFYLPTIYGGSGSHFPLKKIRVGRDSDFGYFLYTDWGQNIGKWGEWILELDARSKRGLATGIDIKYSDTDPWGNRYKGLLDTYYLHDEGEDFENVHLKRQDRGRIKWDHRHQFPFQIRADVEISYLSDDNFLNEYFEKEAKEEKEQETLFYLRRLYDNHGMTFLSKWRLNDFQNTTEKLPEVSYHLVGEPVVDEKHQIQWLENLYFTTHSSVGQNRRRVSTIDGDNALNRVAWRADTDNQLNYPFQLGVLNINPALGLRLTSYEESIFEKHELTRVSGLARLNIATHFYRNYEVRSDLLDIQNLQHILTPRLEYLDIFGTTHPPDELIQFDEVDTVNDVRSLRLGVLNRLKTWRGEGKKRKAEEFLYFDVSVPFYPNENRDNEGDDFGNLEYRTRWFITQKLSLLSDGEYNFSAGKMDVFNIGLSYRLLPNGSIFIGDRYIRDDSSIVTFAVSYDFSERWSMRFLEQYDLTNKEFTEQKLVLTRYFHRFVVDFEFERDEGEDNVGFRVALTTLDIEGNRKKKPPTETIPTLELLERMSRDQYEE